MHGKTLFTIPIYQRSCDEHSALMLGKKREYINKFASKHFPNELLESQFDSTMFYPWKYSQVIGYVEINVEFNDLKAYYWWVKAENITFRLKVRVMEEKGKLADVSKITYPNKKIRKDIKEFVQTLPQLRAKFKNKYFDTNNLEIILEVIDFKKIDFNVERT